MHKYIVILSIKMHPFDFCFYSTKIAENIRDFYCIFHGNNVAINMLVMDFVRFSLRNYQIFVLASHVNMEYDHAQLYHVSKGKHEQEWI